MERSSLTKSNNSALLAEDNAVITQTGEGYYTEIMANGHPIIADEPITYGGTDKGPTPYDLLSASLGACVGMTLRMYANRKKWPLEAVKVRTKHRKIHAKDCADCDTRGGYIDVFEQELDFSGPLDNGQKQRLMEIAGKCPVHRTLHSEVVIKSRMMENI